MKKKKNGQGACDYRCLSRGRRATEIYVQLSSKIPFQPCTQLEQHHHSLPLAYMQRLSVVMEMGEIPVVGGCSA